MQSYKILVVDDEEHIRKILKFKLEKHGYYVITADNGEVALKMVRRENPDLIILDLMMPKMDGFEVCRRIRKNFQTAQIPIIMLTAKSDMVDKIKGLGVTIVTTANSDAEALKLMKLMDFPFRL